MSGLVFSQWLIHRLLKGPTKLAPLLVFQALHNAQNSDSQKRRPNLPQVYVLSYMKERKTCQTQVDYLTIIGTSSRTE